MLIGHLAREYPSVTLSKPHPTAAAVEYLTRRTSISVESDVWQINSYETGTLPMNYLSKSSDRRAKIVIYSG
jgi:hypothetical protein